MSVYPRRSEVGVTYVKSVWMSDGDIALSFNRADDKKEQIKILAELNAVSKDVIMSILESRSDVDLSTLHKPKKKVVKSKPKALTPEDFDLIEKLYYEEKSDREIAMAIGRSTGPVAAWRRKRNLPSNYKPGHQRSATNGTSRRGRHLPPERHRKYLELYNKGMSDNEIAKEMGLSGGSVICQWRKRHGLPTKWKQDVKEDNTLT